MRRAARTDANHCVIVDTFRALGCSVQSLASIGQGCPDLLVGLAGKNVLVEVKDPLQPPSKRRLTPDQQDWHADWRGKVLVVETVEQVKQIVALMHGRLIRSAIAVR